MTAVLQGLLEMLQNGQSRLFDGVGIFALLSQKQSKLTARAANRHNSMHS
jgi:hypothetical protein